MTQYLRKLPRKVPRRIEDDMCGALMDLIEPFIPRYPKLNHLYHIPNEGHRAPWMAAKMGIKRGMPDYCLPAAARGYHGCYFELKAPGKKPSAKQIERMVYLAGEGYYVFWTDNLQKCFNKLLGYVKLVYGEIDEI